MSVEFVDISSGPKTTQAESGYTDAVNTDATPGGGATSTGRHQETAPMSATKGDRERYESVTKRATDVPPDRSRLAPAGTVRGELGLVRFQLWQNLANDLARIEVSRGVMSGEPVVRGTTITVTQIQHLAALGMDISRIIEEFNGTIETEDVRQAFQFAARLTAPHPE